MASLEFRPRHELDPEPWDRLADASDEAWLWHRADLIDALCVWPDRRDLSFAVTDANGELLAIVPLQLCAWRAGGIVGRRRLDSFGGPACRPGLPVAEAARLLTAIGEHLAALLESHGAEWLDVAWSALSPGAGPRFDPLPELGLAPAPRETWMVDLAATPETIRARYSSLTRRELRKAAREPYVLREAQTAGDIETYYDLHCETYRRTGAVPHPFDYFRMIHERFVAKGLARILFLERAGRVVAAQNTSFYKGGAVYWTGASASDRVGGENRILFDDQIMCARARGCLRYETGEAFVASADRKERGLSDFKRSFGSALAPMPAGRRRSRKWKPVLMQAMRDVVRAWQS